MTPGRRRLHVMALAIAVGAASCSSRPAATAPLPARPETVDVTIREYRFEYRRDIGSGRVVFRARNLGRLEHQMRLFPLDEDLPPIADQLAGSERRQARPFGGMLRPPGTSGAYAVNLRSGQRYALICFIRDADGEVHARKGMASEFRAR